MKRFILKNAAFIAALCMALAFCSCGYINGLLGADYKNTGTSGQCVFRFIDVGQGDASLIISDAGNILIDAGPASSEDTLAAYISEYTQTIDYFIMTHPHEDHIGGAVEVFDKFTVKNVIMPNADYNSTTYTKVLDKLEEESSVNVIEAVPGSEYALGGLKFRILAPNSTKYDSTNNYSVVAKFTYGNVSVLYCGDAEKESEEEMLSKWTADDLTADVMKIGHHGSSSSTTPDFLNAVSPKYAVISCGKGNSYGHPHAETIEKLKKRDITICRTDTDGTVTFVTDGTTITKE